MKWNSTLKWLLHVTGKVKWLVGFLVVVQSFMSVLGIVFALSLRRFINRAVAGAQKDFWIAVAMLLGILLLQTILSALNRLIDEYARAEVENRFKEKLFSVLLMGEYASVTAVHSGEWMNRLTSDTKIVAEGVTQIVPGMLGMSVRLIGALSAILWLEPCFFSILVPGGIAMVLLTYAFRKVLKRLHKNIQEADGTLRIFLQERLESLAIVRTFAKEDQTVARAKERMREYKAAKLKRSNFSNLCNIGFSMAMKGVYLLGIGFCGYRILMGTMSYGDLMAIMQLIGQVQNPFANITGFLPRYYSMVASAERLLEAEQFEADKKELISEEMIQKFYQTDLQTIRLIDVYFTYQPPIRIKEEAVPMPVVLKHINLTIRKGEYIAFIGPSGCGKSTILKLLMCLYDLDFGERLMETKKGTKLLTTEWRRLFAYVPQGNQLLSGTIREIIAFGDPQKERDERGIYHALQIACAEEFVKKLDKGLDTLLGEHGQGLSEGQMQRIAIARAIFSGHPILILDEATSALDEITAGKLLENLRQMTNKTVLMVTHRLEQTEFFDKEIVFSKEEIYQVDIMGKECR